MNEAQTGVTDITLEHMQTTNRAKFQLHFTFGWKPFTVPLHKKVGPLLRTSSQNAPPTTWQLVGSSAILPACETIKLPTATSFSGSIQ